MLRALAGLSQAELAERAGVSVMTVSHAETGRHEMTGRTAAKLARALGYDDAAQMFAAVAVIDALGQDHHDDGHAGNVAAGKERDAPAPRTP